jgi:hypothetical protein
MGKKFVITAVVLVIGGAVGTLARAMVSSDGSTGVWVWRTDVPGKPISASGLAAIAAQRSGVDVRSLREVVKSRSGHGSLSVLAAQNGAGEVCIGYTRDGGALSSEFRCLAGDEASEPLTYFASSGGATPASVRWASVAGVTRSDVMRVAIRFANGIERDLTLNGWRGFSYYADTEAAIPTALLAFRADGTKVAEVDLRTISLPLDVQPKGRLLGEGQPKPPPLPFPPLEDPPR